MYVYIALFIVVVAMIIGFLSRKTGSVEEFWVNGSKTSTFLLICTIVSTQVGAGTIVGIASSTYEFGTGFGLVALASTLTGFMLLAVYSKRIKEYTTEKGVYTLPEFVGLHFGRVGEISSAIVIAFAYVGLLGGQIVALSSFLSAVGIGNGVSIVWIAGFGAVLYCAFAGLRGDIYADVWYFLIMLIACIISYLLIFNSSLSFDFDKISASILSPVTFGGYTYLIAGLILGAIVPLVSMELWMRIFSAKNYEVSKKALIASAICVVPFYLLPLIVGLLAHAVDYAPNNKEALFLEFISFLNTDIAGTIVLASITAVILSTFNTYSIVLGGVISRNLLNAKNDLKLNKILLLTIGFLATVIAYMSGEVVSLILGSFYMILALFPVVVCVLFGIKVSNNFAAAGVIIGAIGALASYPYIGPQAFIPGLLLSTILILAGAIKSRLS